MIELIIGAGALAVGYLAGRARSKAELAACYESIKTAGDMNDRQARTILRLQNSVEEDAAAYQGMCDRAFAAEAKLARLTDRDERGRFVKREVV